MKLEKSDWTFKVGESAQFVITISGRIDGYYSITYEIGPEKMLPTKTRTFSDNRNTIYIDGGTMLKSGFLRCNVVALYKGRKYYLEATAAFEPERIKPTIKQPKDFDKFWEKQIKIAKKVPLDMEIKFLANQSTGQYDVYQVSYQNNEFYNYSYGLLTIPKKNGKYPAIIRFPGAGVKPVNPESDFANLDFITLSLYIHPFPGNWNKVFYDSLRNSSYINYKYWGIHNREIFYYKRVVLGCVKAVDVIYTLNKFDNKNLIAWGASQGGALAIMTTALDNRIKRLVAFCPAMCDYTGYLKGRAGGWPHYFNLENLSKFNNKEVLRTLPYYDVVNFARKITVPGFYSWGFNDNDTPPTSFYSAYNQIRASKEIFIIPHIGHYIHQDQTKKMIKWVVNNIK